MSFPSRRRPTPTSTTWLRRQGSLGCEARWARSSRELTPRVQRSTATTTSSVAPPRRSSGQFGQRHRSATTWRNRALRMAMA
eukprot:10336228-Lingulodinium_polyedra.AAC.1